MAKKNKTKSRAKIQNRALNAFEIAEREVKSKRNTRHNSDYESESDDPYRDPDASQSDNNGEVKEEDDEEIDSDEAFGSSEEEEILDSSSWKNKRKSWKKKHQKKSKGGDDSDDDLDLNEDDDEDGYESIDESELVSLSAVWDMDDKDLEEQRKAETQSTKSAINEIKLNEQAGASSEEDSGSQSSDDSDSSEGEDDGSDSDDSDELEISEDDDDLDDLDESQLKALRAMIADKDNTDIVTFENAEKHLNNQKLVQVANVTEGEFAVPSGAKLSLDDLANSVNDSSSLTLLQDAEKSAPLSVPLPKRLQERLDRRVAYDITKKEVNKWKDTVYANRNAETLQFPINPGPEFVKPSSFAPLEPETSLEKRVNAILEQSALADEKSESTFEQLAPSTLSMAELRKRRNELRMMRELMFREEQKAKRIKKIKSKTYRRIHKKEREKDRELIEGDSDDEDHDIKRAEERMSLRHKNTGKWAKSMVKQGFTKDKATRSEMEEMLRRGEKLRTKIYGHDDGDEEVYQKDEDEFINEQEQVSDDEEVKRIKERAGKGVLAMKFMRDAEAAQKKANETAKAEIRRAKEGYGFEEDDDTKGANEVINEGRRKYMPGTNESKTELDQVMDDVRDEFEDDNLKSLENRLSGKRKNNSTHAEEPETKVILLDNEDSKPQKSSLTDFAIFDSEDDKESANDDINDDDDEENPWLALSGEGSKRKKTVNVIGRDSSNAEKTQDKLRKSNERLRSRKGKKEDTLIDMNQTLKVVDPFASDAEVHDSDDFDENSHENRNARGNKRVVLKQTDLVKRAFADDDVVADFEEEKRLIAEEDGDKEVDVTLPGWGSWGGTDIAPKKKYVKKVKGIVNQKNRKDFSLDKVIINERYNKKAAVYNAKDVPFPFETREQYERSLRMPIGQEWSSRSAHQKLIKPRVIVKPGLVIDPIKAPFQDEDNSD